MPDYADIWSQLFCLFSIETQLALQLEQTCNFTSLQIPVYESFSYHLGMCSFANLAIVVTVLKFALKPSMVTSGVRYSVFATFY